MHAERHRERSATPKKRLHGGLRVEKNLWGARATRRRGLGTRANQGGLKSMTGGTSLRGVRKPRVGASRFLRKKNQGKGYRVRWHGKLKTLRGDRRKKNVAKIERKQNLPGKECLVDFRQGGGLGGLGGLQKTFEKKVRERVEASWSSSNGK